MSDLLTFDSEIPRLSSFIKPTKDNDIFELALKKRIITPEMIRWYLDKAAVLHLDALKEEADLKESLIILSESPIKLIQDTISQFSKNCMQRPKFTSELDEELQSFWRNTDNIPRVWRCFK
jgi:hypothetical protein